MDVKQTKFTLKYLPPRRSILIEGIHGLGKSQVVAQVCKELSIETGIPHILIDIRLSQREEGDIIGLPKDMQEVTVKQMTYVNGEFQLQDVALKNVMIHDLPSWFPRDPKARGILFFDELHYANKGSIQACMEAFLDHRLNQVPIPENVRVVAAGNQIQDIYGGTTLNPAVYDRPLKIEFKPTVPEWMEYVKSEEYEKNSGYPIHRSVILFLNKFESKLDPPEAMEPGNAYPSRRSWCTLSEDIQYLDKVSHKDIFRDLDYLIHLAKGRLGGAVAIDYVDFIRKEFKFYSPKDILDKWDEDMEKDFATFQAAEVGFYTNEIVAHIAKVNKKLTVKQKANLEKFIKAIPKETASDFWVAFAKGARDIAMDWYQTPSVKDYIYSRLNKEQAMK